MARNWHSRILVPVVAALAMAGVASSGAPAAEEAAAGQDAPQAAGKKKHDPAETQRTLDHASKLIDTGKSEPAIQALTALLSSGNLPPASMAKALLLRGTAYRQQHKPAQAISDLTSALWLKGGLSESERADGLRQRTAAYQEAGLGQAGEAQPATAATRDRTRTASAAQPWGDGPAATAPAAALREEPASAPASSGGWDLFGSLFGGNAFFASSSSAPPPPAAPPPPSTAAIPNGEATAAERPATPRPAPASTWSRQTQVETERTARVETGTIARSEPVPAKSAVAHAKVEPVRAKVEPAKTEATAVASKAGGHLRIQIAAVRTQAEAKALAAKVKREHAGALASREPEIDQTVMGNMGAFYRVLLGPFASTQETASLCAKLKGTGLDCLVMAQ